MDIEHSLFVAGNESAIAIAWNMIAEVEPVEKIVRYFWLTRDEISAIA